VEFAQHMTASSFFSSLVSPNPHCVYSIAHYSYVPYRLVQIVHLVKCISAKLALIEVVCLTHF